MGDRVAGIEPKRLPIAGDRPIDILPELPGPAEVEVQPRIVGPHRDPGRQSADRSGNVAGVKGHHAERVVGGRERGIDTHGRQQRFGGLPQLA